MGAHQLIQKLADLDNQSLSGTDLDLSNLDVTVKSITATEGISGQASGSTYTQTFATADRTIANATVGADIAAFTDPPSAAEMALLRTFVNALKADAADLRQGLTAVIDDLQTVNIVD